MYVLTFDPAAAAGGMGGAFAGMPLPRGVTPANARAMLAQMAAAGVPGMSAGVLAQLKRLVGGSMPAMPAPAPAYVPPARRKAPAKPRRRR